MRTCTGSFDGHPGFGEVVNHFADGVSVSTNFAGTHRTLLAGPYHALHEYRWRYLIDGHDVTVIVQWFFATGRDHPIFAITFDLSRGSRRRGKLPIAERHTAMCSGTAAAAPRRVAWVWAIGTASSRWTRRSAWPVAGRTRRLTAFRIR